MEQVRRVGAGALACIALVLATLLCAASPAYAATIATTAEELAQEYSLSGLIDWMLEQDDLTTAQVTDLENAQSMLVGYVESGEIDLADSDDAAALDNVEHSVEIIATIEDLRDADEYYNRLYDMPDVYTNFTMLVGSAYTANVSIYEVAHVSSYATFASNENLAWGYTDPTAGWYTKEKAYVDAAMEELGYSADTLTADEWSAVLALAATYGTIGHYTNLFYGVSSGSDILQGVGYTTESYLYSTTSSSNAATVSRYSGYAAYTADEFAALIDEYRAYLLEDLTDGWTAWGSCEWMIDGDGVLYVRPLGNGAMGLAPNCSTTGDVGWYDERTSITKAVISGNVVAQTSACGYFYGCTNLAAIEGLENIDLSNASIINYLFYSCSSLTSVDVSAWDVSGVRGMTYLFYGCSSLASLDLSEWDTSSVTDLSSAFYGCSALTELDISGWTTPSLVSMPYAFRGCSKLATVDVSGWDTSNLVYAYGAFYGCSGLTSLDVSGWDTSRATNLQAMFYNCSSLTSLDVGGWDVSSALTLYYTFGGCSSLTSLDVSGWNPSSSSSISYMFYNCSSLASLDVSGWDTTSVTNFSYAFFGCYALEALDVSGWTTSQVTTMAYLFYGCRSLGELDLSGWDTSSVTTYTYAFYNCRALRVLKLGADFTLTSVLVLPKDSTYGSGVWVSDDGTVYESAASIPANTAATYYAVFPSAAFGSVVVAPDECAGVSLTASVEFDADLLGTQFVDLAYQWYDGDGNAVSGATAATLDITDDLLGGTYYCVVSDAAGVYSSTLTSATVAAEHAFGDWVETLAATCTTDGLLVRTCEDCGTGESQVIEALGHTQASAVTENLVEATCTAAGSYDSVVYCATCGEELSRTEVSMAALGHDYASVVTEPTCTSAGYTTYTCTRCGAAYVADETAALGHSYASEVTTAATCTQAGVRTYTCSTCGDSYAEAIEATGHAQAAAVTENLVEATCTAAGSYDSVVYCATCGEELSRTEVSMAALGHDYAGVVTEATCTSAGYTTYTCTRCGAAYVADETALVDHVYAATLGKDAAGAADGTIVYTCTACGSSYAEDIAYGRFVDVQDAGKSYYDAVYALADLGYVTGTSTTQFSPNGTLTRAQMVSVLWRILCPQDYAELAAEGYASAQNETAFTDVAGGKYYTAAVAWAVGQGIVKGTSDTTFGPDETCTFQMFCTILARLLAGGDDALEALYTDAEAAALLAGFSDASSISGYADKAMAFCAENGLVSGYGDGTVRPGEDVYRWRMASLVYRALLADLFV